jgi:hypothetical protein
VQNFAFLANFFVAKRLISLQNTPEKSALSERADKERIAIFLHGGLLTWQRKQEKEKSL